jgi:hypothetical protein
MELAVCSAAISLLFLKACPFASAGSQHGVSIKAFTSQDEQFWDQLRHDRGSYTTETDSQARDGLYHTFYEDTVSNIRQWLDTR